MFLVSLIVILLFGGYLFVAGIPMTKSRNLFNEGLEFYNNRMFDKARTRFEQAQKMWYSKEAQSYLEKIDNQE